MKQMKLFTVTAFVFAITFFSACDQVSDLADVTFDATLKTNIEATSSGEMRGNLYPFSGNAVIDPASDENVNKYWDNIKQWNIQKITVFVDYIDKEANLSDGKLIVKDDQTQEELYTVAAENKLLKAGVKVLEVTEGDWSKIVTALNAKHKLIVHVEGALDQPSIVIRFRVEIAVKVTANPL